MHDGRAQQAIESCKVANRPRLAPGRAAPAGEAQGGEVEPRTLDLLATTRIARHHDHVKPGLARCARHGQAV